VSTRIVLDGNSSFHLSEQYRLEEFVYSNLVKTEVYRALGEI